MAKIGRNLPCPCSAAAAKNSNDRDEQLHALDYMTYAYLQLARDNEARLAMEDAAQVSGYTRPAGPYAAAAIPARYAIERGDWNAAMKLKRPQTSSIIQRHSPRFARALGAARGGNPTIAQQEVEELARLRDALKAAKDQYWATEVEVSRLAASAWTALALGKRDEALELMRSVAAIEDKNEKHIVTPGRLVPARELLGQMLLELKRPAEALKEFEVSQTREPNRFHGFAGAAEAAMQSGDVSKAKAYYTRLIELTDKGEPRPELDRAEAVLVQR
jgi:tetratricopeptide (TPR) repeat protein